MWAAAASIIVLSVVVMGIGVMFAKWLGDVCAAFQEWRDYRARMRYPGMYDWSPTLRSRIRRWLIRRMQ